MKLIIIEIGLFITKVVSKFKLLVFDVSDQIACIFGFQLFNIDNKKSVNEKIKTLLMLLLPITSKYELIRIGSINDGGYLIPNDLGGVRYCYSPGVSDNSEFEYDLISRGIYCYLADGTVDKPNLGDGFEFIQKNLDVYDTLQTTSLKTWIDNKEHDSEMILQMDIEGHEYKVILNTPIEVFQKFRIIVIELHHIEKLGNQLVYDLIHSSIQKLQVSFTPVHLHANNYSKGKKIGKYKLPHFFEVTLLRNDRLENLNVPNVFSDIPHRLDQKNVEKRADFNISELVKMILSE